MNVERSKWVLFIQSLGFFRNFEEQKIARLCSELQGRFLSPFDALYRTGDPIDNVYILKNGILVKKVVVDLEQSNRWPVVHSSRST